MTIKYETNANIVLVNSPVSGAETIAIVYTVGNSYAEIRQGRTACIRIDKKQFEEIKANIEFICNDLK